MSARILNLLAEPKPEKPESSSKTSAVAPIPGQDQCSESNSECPPPPPGLEKFGPPTPTQTSGQLAKASMSETVEDACLSSSGSTRFDEDCDGDPATWYSQDWELSAWGQSYAYPPYPPMPEAGAAPFPVVPSEGAILSTTPLRPPTLSSAPAPPVAPPVAPTGWEWPPMPHMEADMMHAHAAQAAACYPEHSFPEQPLMPMHPMPMQPMPPMVPGVHYPMPETTFLGYGHPPVGPELQPPSATLGSVGHEVGNCKPCAFVYTKGCQSGAQCAFCHLCPPGEKDRRKKVKHIMARIRRKSSKGGDGQRDDE